jgi:hypothetical protein
VCVKLQAEKRSLPEVRLLFDACVEKYPIMGEYLSPGASIIHSPTFENAVVKVLNDLPLSSAEQRAVRGFVATPAAASTDSSTDVDFATGVLRKAKKQRRSERATVQYEPLLHVIPPEQHVRASLFGLQACLDIVALIHDACQL